MKVECQDKLDETLFVVDLRSRKWKEGHSIFARGEVV